MGGDAARSRAVYGVLVALAVFTAAELVRDGALPVQDGLWALAAACAALWVAKAVLDRTLFRRGDDRPAPVAAVAAIGLLLGVISVLPFMLALVIAGEALPGLSIPGLLAGAVIRCAVLFPVIAYLVGLRRWYMTARHAAERELVLAEAARIEAGDDVEATRSLIIETARRAIGPSQREASDLLEAAVRSESADDLTRAAESLRSAARTAVRSTSHHLWVDDGAAASIRWRSIVPAALVRYPLPLFLPLVVILGSTIVRSYGRANPGLAVAAAAVVVTVMSCLIYLLARALIARSPGATIPITAVAVLAAPLLSQVAASAITDRPLQPVPIIVITLLTAAFTVASSVVLMVRDSGAAVIQAMVDDRARADAQQAALTMLNRRLSRELATHLHGTMQPQLLAAAVALRAAVDGDDPRAVAVAVAQAEAALDVPVRPPAAARAPALEDVAGGLTERWGAMLELHVTVSAPPGAPAPPGGVTRALDECLNNAVIHGCATRAHVSITHVADGWRIEVADDGTGPAAGAPGLGSSVLDELTRGDWSLAAGSDGGAVVRAHVPHRHPAPAG